VSEDDGTGDNAQTAKNSSAALTPRHGNDAKDSSAKHDTEAECGDNYCTKIFYFSISGHFDAFLARRLAARTLRSASFTVPLSILARLLRLVIWTSSPVFGSTHHARTETKFPTLYPLMISQ
jgi:hypothetical protein